MGLIWLEVTMVVIFFLIIIVFFTVVKVNFSREKYSIFECGFDLISSLRLPFSLHFYFIAIVFLVFDVEMVLLIPFIFFMKLGVGGFILSFFFFFFIILISSFFYELYMGFLNWVF